MKKLDPDPDLDLNGSGSVPNCHGSTTLLLKVIY
jgi:hypothetical protein